MKQNMTSDHLKQKKILLTGATGYIGARLAPMLIRKGFHIRAMARSISKLKNRPWATSECVELVQGDVFDLDSLIKAASGCQAVYYLVHSMNPHEKNFEIADRTAAHNMVKAASSAKVERIIYLGGLGNFDQPHISKHLLSRYEVAQILQAGPVPTTFLKAAMILGAGSASFEIMRYLVERLPIMITPSWVNTRSQPIAIRNVLTYLIGCLETDDVLSQTFDIGGPDILTYRELFDIYAQEAGLKKRLIIPVPVLTPKLSAYWIHLVTPVPSAIAMPLAQGLKNEVICTENRIHDIIPQNLISCREAIQLALKRMETHQVETFWSDAGPPLLSPESTTCGDAPYSGGTVLQCGYKVVLKASAEDAWKPIARIGGNTGWYFGNTIWHIRGVIDRLIGGIGYRRGRRHPEKLNEGDALDFFRVADVSANSHLRLLAESKIPGEAILNFEISSVNEDSVELILLLQFHPKGLAGILYWYLLLPIHELIYRGMLGSIAKRIGKPILSAPRRLTATDSRSCKPR